MSKRSVTMQRKHAARIRITYQKEIAQHGRFIEAFAHMQFVILNYLATVSPRGMQYLDLL